MSTLPARRSKFPDYREQVRIACFSLAILLAVGCEQPTQPKAAAPKIQRTLGQNQPTQAVLAGVDTSDSLPKVVLPAGVLVPVQENGKWGLLADQGTWKILPRFTEFHGFFKGIALVAEDSLYGYVDTNGTFLWKANTQAAHVASILPYTNRFQLGLAVRCTKPSACGYVDTTGRFVIAPEFDFAWPFLPGGLALVKRGNQLGFINRKGQAVGPQNLESLGDLTAGLFNDGLQPASQQGKWGYLTPSGRWAIPPVYQAALPFSDGRAAVRTTNGWAYIAPTGAVVTWVDFTAARPFCDGLAAVRVGERWHFIDATGKAVLFPRYAYVGNFTDNLAPVREGAKWGAINRKGELVIPLDYDALEIRNGWPGVLAKLPSGWGLLNPENQWIVPAMYDTLHAYSSGFAPVKRRWGKWGLMRTDGSLATPLQFDALGICQDGLIPAQQGRYWGLIDTNGNWVVPPQYEQVHEPVMPPRLKEKAAR